MGLPSWRWRVKCDQLIVVNGDNGLIDVVILQVSLLLCLLASLQLHLFRNVSKNDFCWNVKKLKWNFSLHLKFFISIL